MNIEAKCSTRRPALSSGDEVSRDAERLCLTHQLTRGIANYECTGRVVASGRLEQDCTSFIRIDSRLRFSSLVQTIRASMDS